MMSCIECTDKIIRYHVDRYYVDILQNIMKIVDRIPTKIIEWQYCKSLKLRILWNSFTYHSVAPDIQILMSMMG